ncbi:MAG: hypothetical protein JW855_03210 [Gammaproteobacteria bacterium]|nr:hypothetical protein [Gammaproteobacteria bacterium]
MQNSDIKFLDKQFKNIVRFLKKPKVGNYKSHKNLWRSFWYLVIGPEKTGKTSLLNNSELSFIFLKTTQKKQIEPTKNYDWWVTKDAVIVDASGKYFQEQQDESISYKKSWINFLKLFKQDAYQHNLKGLIIVLDIKQLIHSNSLQEENLYETIKKRIQEISKYFSKNVPIFLVINKIDLIVGFSEFFDNASLEERQQILGVFLDESKKFSNAFNQIIQKLVDQSAWLLKNENDSQKCNLINNFPLQFAQLGPKLTKLLENIQAKNYNIQGIFFTSAIKRFFIHKLFKKFILMSNLKIDFPQNKRKKIIQYMVYVIILIFGVCLSFLWFKIFEKQANILNKIQNATISYNTLNTLQLPENVALSKKMALLKAIDQYSSKTQTNQPILSWFLTLPEGQKVQNKAKTAVQNALKKMLFDRVVVEAEKSLSDPDTPLITLYNNLKFYLILSNKGPIDKDFVSKQAETIWHHIYPDVSEKDSFSYVQLIFTQLGQPIKPNEKTMEAAQNRLKNLNPYQLAEIIIRAEANDQLLSLNFDSNKSAASILTFINKNVYIPSIYTQPVFDQIYPNAIKKAAQMILKDNWILGKSNYSQLDEKKFTQNLLDNYLNNYATVWHKFLSNINLINFTDITQLNQALKILSNDDSPLKQLINLVQTNLPFEVVSKDNTLKILKTINVNDLQKAIDNLHNYFSPTTVDNKNPDEAAFKLASLRVRNGGRGDAIENLLTQAQLYPEPVKSWVYNLATNSWQLLLFHAQNYMNDIWTKNIFPQYQNQIEGRYPLLSTASTDIDLKNFDYFFRSGGVFSHFIRTYLDPFLQNKNGTWALSIVDGAALNLSHTTLNTLQKAYNLQYIYFKNNRLDVPFTLKLEEMGSNIKSLTLYIGNKKIVYLNQPPYQTAHFSWPGVINPGFVQVVFIDDQGKMVTITPQGPWGLFKLLEGAHSKHIGKPGHYSLILNKDGYAAKLTLVTENGQNVFSLSKLDGIHLPDSLL